LQLHITGEKYKQIYNLYLNKRETIAAEIANTRLLCRHCHELHTCLQRGGKALRFYYTDSQIETMKQHLQDQARQQKCNQKIQEILANFNY
jgi:hypothetical protein